jgi:hypothetical protein
VYKPVKYINWEAYNNCIAKRLFKRVDLLRCPLQGFTYTSKLNNDNEPPSKVLIINVNYIQ